MKFRPCIDIHGGSVKQIVGGSLSDSGEGLKENFVSEYSAAHYARLYKKYGLCGGHIIMLDKAGTDMYLADKKQAIEALAAYEGGMQIGGGITPENCLEYLNAGASHVIVTSYVFRDGKISFERLERLKNTAGRERLVLDLSCRKRDGAYYIVTDRWQKFTEVRLNRESLETLAAYCDEFLVHAADAEGKSKGIEEGAAAVIGEYSPIKAVYAGGIGSFDDIERLKRIGKNKVDFTVGSALDIFGGSLGFESVVKFSQLQGGTYV